MSLINKLLKDLEQRHPNPTVIAYFPKKNQQPHTVNLTYYLITLGLIILFATLLFIFLPAKPKSIKHIITGIKKTDFIESKSEWIQPVQISGISVNEKLNTTELSFLLDHNTLYTLFAITNKNEFLLSFDDASFEAQVPPINPQSSGLSAFSHYTINGKQIFKFKLQEDARLQSVNFINENANHQLIVSIERSQIFSREIKNPLVKTPAFQSLLTQQYERAIEYAEKGNYQIALQKLEKILEAQPEFKEVRTSLAALLIDQGKAKDAEKLVDQGLIISPDYLPFVELKSRLLTMYGKLTEALSLLQRNAPSITDNPDYYAFMAALHEQNNNDLLAVKLYKQLLAINPDNNNWWFGLAVSLDKLGQIAAAKATYDRALSGGKLDLDSATYIQKRLQTLRESDDATR